MESIFDFIKLKLMERIDIYSIIRKTVIVFENLAAIFFLGLFIGTIRLIISVVKLATIPGKIKSLSQRLIITKR